MLMTEELEKKVEALERILSRERKARKQAEELLEKRSLEIFIAKQEVQEQMTEAKLKQLQLSFLMGLSADIWIAESVSHIVQVYLKRAGEFLDRAHCVFFQIEKNKKGELIKKGQLFPSTSAEDKAIQTHISDLLECFDLQQILNLLEQANSESQLIEMTDLIAEEAELNYCYLVPLFSINNTFGIASFIFHREQEIDIYKLQTMESSRSMLTVAIQRKLASISLQKRYAELKQTYEKLEDTKNQLVQSERMASLGQLAAGVAHEINNPVGFIISNQDTLGEYIKVLDQLLAIYLEMVEEPTEINQHLIKLKQLWQNEDIDFVRDDVTDLLSASKNGLMRVRDIVSGLKTFSHSDTKVFEPTNLNDCLEDSIQLVWNELKYNCELEKDFCTSPIVNGNSGQLQQVFVNMLINAKQAMEGDGVITVATKRESDKIKLIISDTGKGISKQDLDKLFTPFFTTKPVGVGTGLGLSISYGILQDHNATINVDSKLGQGTKFILTFKACEEA